MTWIRLQFRVFLWEVSELAQLKEKVGPSERRGRHGEHGVSVPAAKVAKEAREDSESRGGLTSPHGTLMNISPGTRQEENMNQFHLFTPVRKLDISWPHRYTSS